MDDNTGKHDPISMLYVALQRMEEKSEKTAEVLFEKLDKTNDKVDKLSEIVSQQALLFERLATIDTNHKDSTARLHQKVDKLGSDNDKRMEKLEEKLAIFENYMLHDGCPAHKSFLASRDFQVKKWHETSDSINSRVSDINQRLEKVEDAPMGIMKTMGRATIVVFGTGIGMWILYKLGLEMK